MVAWKPVELQAGVQFPAAALYPFAFAKAQVGKDTCGYIALPGIHITAIKRKITGVGYRTQ